MLRLILKLCLLCAVTAAYASGPLKIPDDGSGGGGGGSNSTCAGLDGITCVCPVGQTCYKAGDSCFCQ